MTTYSRRNRPLNARMSINYNELLAAKARMTAELQSKGQPASPSSGTAATTPSENISPPPSGPASSVPAPSPARSPSIPPALVGSRCVPPLAAPPRPAHTRVRPKTSSTPLPLLAVSAAVPPHVPDRSTHPETLDSKRNSSILPHGGASPLSLKLGLAKPISAGMRRFLQIPPYTRSKRSSICSRGFFSVYRMKQPDWELRQSSCCRSFWLWGV